MLVHWKKSVATLSWTWRFVAGHIPLVLGLGAIAGAERAVSQLWEAPGVLPFLLEALTWGSRIFLVLVVIRLGVVADGRFSRRRIDPNVTCFLADHWQSWVLNGILLVIAFVVFSLPELWGNGLRGSERAVFFAVLLGIKNLSVIPLTFVWMVSIARQAVLYEPSRGTVSASS